MLLLCCAAAAALLLLRRPLLPLLPCCCCAVLPLLLCCCCCCCSCAVLLRSLRRLLLLLPRLLLPRPRRLLPRLCCCQGCCCWCCCQWAVGGSRDSSAAPPARGSCGAARRRCAVASMDPNARMQQAVEGVLGGLDRATLRPLRRDAFLCSAKCCESATSSPEQLQGCVEACQQRVGAVEQAVQNELAQFQQRLQRCAMTCSDKVQEKLPADPAKHTPELIAKLQAEAEACANKCVDSHIPQLNKIPERVAALAKK